MADPVVNEPSTPAVAPAPGTPEYDQYIISKYDNQSSVADTPDEPPAPVEEQPAETKPRPDHIPEKFWDAERGEVRLEALLKANAELERRFHEKAKPQDTTPPADGNKTPEEPVTDPADAKAVVEDAGLDFAVFNTEFENEGKLSDASYEKLTKAGISRDIVDAYIAGQAALGAQVVNEIYSMAGGEEQYNSMKNWMKQNVQADDLAAYNRAVSEGSRAEARLAVQAMHSRYTAANGSTPQLIQPNSGTVPGGFASRAEMVAAMRDPRYRSDPAYRQSVENRAALSTSF